MYDLNIEIYMNTMIKRDIRLRIAFLIYVLNLINLWIYKVDHMVRQNLTLWDYGVFSFVLQTTCAYIWGQYLFNDCRMVPHPSKFSTCIIVFGVSFKGSTKYKPEKIRGGCHHVVDCFDRLQWLAKTLKGKH